MVVSSCSHVCVLAVLAFSPLSKAVHVGVAESDLVDVPVTLHGKQLAATAASRWPVPDLGKPVSKGPDNRPLGGGKHGPGADRTTQSKEEYENGGDAAADSLTPSEAADPVSKKEAELEEEDDEAAHSGSKMSITGKIRELAPEVAKLPFGRDFIMNFLGDKAVSQEASYCIQMQNAGIKSIELTKKLKDVLVDYGCDQLHATDISPPQARDFGAGEVYLGIYAKTDPEKQSARAFTTTPITTTPPPENVEADKAFEDGSGSEPVKPPAPPADTSLDPPEDPPDVTTAPTPAPAAA